MPSLSVDTLHIDRQSLHLPIFNHDHHQSLSNRCRCRKIRRRLGIPFPYRSNIPSSGRSSIRESCIFQNPPVYHFSCAAPVRRKLDIFAAPLGTTPSKRMLWENAPSTLHRHSWCLVSAFLEPFSSPFSS